MFDQIRIRHRQGKQFIPDVRTAKLTKQFRGRLLIKKEGVSETIFKDFCPSESVRLSPMRIDLAKCDFCGMCARRFPDKVVFTNDYRLAANDPAQLVITEGEDRPIRINPDLIRPEVRKIFSRSLKLRQVSAGGDNTVEMELNACSNPNFDMGRFGIEFVASPRHADGIIVTGPITKNMSDALKKCWKAVPEPKILVLAGQDAISGGVFAGSEAIDRSFLDEHPVDLYLPGNPTHPLTIINGLLDFMQAFR